MLALASDHVRLLEAPLANEGGSGAADDFLRLANGELDRAYRWAGVILGDEHEAQDATQDALLRAWRSVGSLRDPNGFQAWFDRILLNVCRDRLRRRGKVRPIAIDELPLLATVKDPFKALVD